MKQKLFENIGGNTFKLITESVDEVNPNAKLVRSGLKKVFSTGDKSLSYKRLEGVGFGYIRSVEEAKKTAIQEARILAKEYGYVEDENAQAFVKEDEHDRIDPDQRWDKVPQHPETSAAEPAEAQEVQMGNNIKKATKLLRELLIKKGYSKLLRDAAITNILDQIESAATSLVSTHTS